MSTFFVEIDNTDHEQEFQIRKIGSRSSRVTKATQKSNNHTQYKDGTEKRKAKLFFNELFGCWIKTLFQTSPDRNLNIFYLDGETMNTTNHLKHDLSDFPAKTFYCANDNPEIVTGLSENSVVAYQGFVSQFLEDLEHKDVVFDALWYDGCGSWKGRMIDGVFVSCKHDIESLFDQKRFSKQSVFAVTVSQHGMKGTAEKREQSITNCIERFAKRNSYDVERMVSKFYEIRKDGTYIEDQKKCSAMLFQLYIVS